MPEDIDLTCWYLNQRRCLELIGRGPLRSQLSASALPAADAQYQRIWQLATLKDIITEWLRACDPPTLGQLFITESVQVGQIFTCFSDFYCRGLPKAQKALAVGAADVPPGVVYAKLDDFGAGWKIECKVYHEHLTSSSAFSQLSGRRQLFLLGLISGVRGTVVETVPYVIASILPELSAARIRVAARWTDRRQVFIEAIDSFAAVKSISPVSDESVLERLRGIPEKAVKEAFAEIIGEPTIPRDWGGERSDLYTDRLLLDQERIAAAFAFKGPARLGPMKMTHLGKNGDQIDRLFSEPADLLVLQHCHVVTPPVRAAMRAYAERIGNPRLFCIIDGYDTIRLFRAYGKCGFSAPGSTSPPSSVT